MKYIKQLAPELSEVKSLPGGVLQFVVSHEAPDLVGDVVIQRGIELVSDRVPAQVDHSGRMQDVIGYWDNIKTHGDYTTADLNLVQAGVSKMADLVRALSESGVKLAASIGFQAKKAEPIKPRGYRFEKTLLHEISVVVVPCQPLALQVAKNFGVDLWQEAHSGSVEDDRKETALKRAKLAVLAVNKNIYRSSKK